MATLACRRRWALGALFALAATLCLLAVPGTSQAARFSTYVACSAWRQQADPDGMCFGGDAFGAVLRAFRHDGVSYRVCMREPDGDRSCKQRQTGSRGSRSRVTFIPRGGVGTYVFSWKTRGKSIDRDRIYLAPEGV